MALELPKFIVIQSEMNKQLYLGLNNEDAFMNQYLEFSQIGFLSPFAKFEVQLASGVTGKDGLVHIKNCENMKYLKRVENLSITNNEAEKYWIAATADNPIEDQTNISCTLFKFISVDPATNLVRIQHVQSGCYLRFSSLKKHFVSASYNVPDDRHKSKSDIFKIIDWEPAILPKYVAFKNNNGKYLRLAGPKQKLTHPYMQFSADEIGDPTVPCEIFVTEDRNIRIKSICSKNFWWLKQNTTSDWIYGDSDNGVRSNNVAGNTLFRPVKVDDTKIVHLSRANGNFCQPREYDCLAADLQFFDEEAWLTVENAVEKTEFYEFKYKLDDSSIFYCEEVFLTANSVCNNSKEAITAIVKLPFKDTKTSLWESADFSASSGEKASFDLLLIFNGRVELSGMLQKEFEWGQTQTWNPNVEVVYEVVVPPMSKVTVDLYAMYGKFKVPFSCIQRIILYGGTDFTTELQGGSYTGSNYYNFNFKIKEEKLE